MRRRSALRKYGVVLLLLSPWIVGFIVFTGGPMIISLFWSFTHYDMASAPRWIGLDNYKFMFGLGHFTHSKLAPGAHDPYFWQAVRNTLYIIVFGRAATRRLRPAHGDAAHAPQARRQHVPHPVLHAVDGAQGGCGAGLRLSAQPNERAGDPAHQRGHGRTGAALVLRPHVGQTGTADHGAVGYRRRDRDLPRRPAERAARAL